MRRFKRKSYKKKYTRSSRASASSIARTALRAAKFVKSLVNVEYKNIDASASTIAFSNAGALVNISKCAEGTEYNQRVGRSIKLKSVLVRMTLQINAAATVPCRGRVMLFIDTQNLGAIPSTTDVLNTADTLSPLDINGTAGNRFKVLYDRTYTFTVGNNTACAPKVYKKLHNHAKFKGSTGNDSDCLEGQVYLLFITDVATNVPTYSYNSRVRFLDN